MIDETSLGGELLDEHIRLSLSEVCRICGTREEIVIEMVHEGVVEPEQAGPQPWQFSGLAVTRIQTMLRLQRDLDVNLPGAALALELLDEIERLRRRIRR